jgi:hypothetical protein
MRQRQEQEAVMPDRLASVITGVVAGVVLVTLAACSGLEVRSGASVPLPDPTSQAVYVTATPAGYVAPTPTPWVIYVTPTPGVAVEGGSPTPWIIYVTATPLPVGPFYATPAPGYGAQPIPTLDLSRLTFVPLPEAGVTPSPQPTSTPGVPTRIPSPTPTSVVVIPRDSALYAERMGINFISSAQHQGDGERFAVGLDAGAGWDRFAIYWNEIELEADQYTWDLYDDTVRNDVIYGLHTDAILLGAPQAYQDSRGVPVNLHEPIFIDGTDVPGPGKLINPSNVWAEWVYATVRRYMPDGTLARSENWPGGAGVQVWEVWNEPDFRTFWKGSVEEYARLLKVAYVAIRQADPAAEVAVGGLVLFEQPDFLPRLLRIYQDDPAPVDRRYPFTIVAAHAYSHPPYAFYVIQQIKTQLAAYGVTDVPVWLNESGVSIWDDYPGPSWATRPDQILWRATMAEQAAYIMQNTAFAFMAGAEKVWHFQLYDDCGNQPRGTTFPPHDGSLCASQPVCTGDALGLLRNTADNVCFNQHPQPGTTRLAYQAYHLMAELLGREEVVPLNAVLSGGRWRVIFADQATGEIITIVWDDAGISGAVQVRARAAQAVLIRLDGSREIIAPGVDGNYLLPLEAATNRNQSPDSSYQYMIGGPPLILVEQASQPVVSVLPLLDLSQTAILVRWQTSSRTLGRYQVYYRDDTTGSGWALWFETAAPGEALFAGQTGHSYSFFARGQLPDGTWTAEFPFVQAWTRLE